MRFAVVFKAYAWDSFVERQARRCEASCGSGHFFVALDETAGALGSIPFKNVFRCTNDRLSALGFLARFEVGSLLWWNPDYTHYAFKEAHPGYDFYVFVEYDAVTRGSYKDLVAQACEAGADVVTLPVKVASKRWQWTLPHRQTYSANELAGTLVCISVFSRRALEALARRRREMGASSVKVRFWPSAEVFVPTEARRAGLIVLSLSQFGDVNCYDAFPPMLEEELPPSSESQNLAFFHPVLDPDRYIASLLKSSRVVDFPRSRFRRLLAKVAHQPSRLKVIRAAMHRFGDAARVRRQRLAIQLFGQLVSDSPKERTPCP